MSKLQAIVNDIVQSAYGDYVHPEVQENVDIVINGIATLQAENARLSEELRTLKPAMETHGKVLRRVSEELEKALASREVGGD